MSRHHIQPPVIYMPPPPKPKETRRRRAVRGATTADDAGEVEETVDAAPALAPVAAALPQHARPAEAIDRKNASTTGRLSDDILKTLLQAQEQDPNPGG